VLRLNNITFACEDPRRVAEFWAQVLDDYSAEPSGKSWRASGDGPELFFNRMKKSPTIEVPIHLDVNVPDRQAEVERLLGFGAHIVMTKTAAIGSLEETCTIMRDPEGNGFCVQTPPKTERRYVGNVTFSSAEPERLASFWSEALGWPAEAVGDEFVQMLLNAGLDPQELHAYAAICNPDGSRPRFLFQRREKSRPASYPIHLDFRTDDREAEIDRLSRAGASVVETKSDDERKWTVMRDPERNPFCVE
jgi:predicted enzyme related to lactoylglutathione lyase